MKSSYEEEKAYAGNNIMFEEWGKEKCEQQPSFKYWFMDLTIILA